MNTGSTQNARISIVAIRWLVRETLGNLIMIAILFGFVGRWDWWMGWALSAIYILWSASTAILIMPVNAAMLAERARPHADTKKWDIVLLGIILLPLFVSRQTGSKVSLQVDPTIMSAILAIWVLSCCTWECHSC